MTTTLHKLKFLLKFALDGLLPHTCIGCRTWANELLCPTCQHTLSQTHTQSRSFLPDITHAISLLDYRGLTESLLHAYKFGMLKNLSPYFTKIILSQFPKNPYPHAIWTPVPFHKGRRRQRGYDHVRLLFEPVLAHWNQTLTTLTRRIKNTPHLYNLSPELRQHALANAFELYPNTPIAHKTIVIVDDILTTGTTTRELAKLFLLAGARDVRVVALAGGQHVPGKSHANRI